MAFLTKQAILAAADRQSRVVSVPEWGGEVRVGAMSGLQRDAYHTELAKRRPPADGGEGKPAGWTVSITALVVAFSVIDDQGKPLFTPDDIVALGEKSGAALQRVFEVANEINKLTPATVEKQKGESSGVRGDSSPSDSPPASGART